MDSNLVDIALLGQPCAICLEPTTEENLGVVCQCREGVYCKECWIQYERTLVSRQSFAECPVCRQQIDLSEKIPLSRVQVNLLKLSHVCFYNSLAYSIGFIVWAVLDGIASTGVLIACSIVCAAVALGKRTMAGRWHVTDDGTIENQDVCFPMPKCWLVSFFYADLAALFICLLETL
jgi:hypothetical protein